MRVCRSSVSGTRGREGGREGGRLLTQFVSIYLRVHFVALTIRSPVFAQFFKNHSLYASKVDTVNRIG